MTITTDIMDPDEAIRWVREQLAAGLGTQGDEGEEGWHSATSGAPRWQVASARAGTPGPLSPAPGGGDAPRYAIVRLPGPGLAVVADRRDGGTQLWSRSLRGRGSFGYRPRCANCGVAVAGNWYRPPQYQNKPERLCVACVEGAS